VSRRPGASAVAERPRHPAAFGGFRCRGALGALGRAKRCPGAEAANLGRRRLRLSHPTTTSEAS